MKLPFSFKNSKKDKHAYYVALLLTSEKTTAIILEEIQGKLKIVNNEKQYFDGEIENLQIDDLISSIDKVLTRAAEVLPADAEITKTVFGVKENWVEKETKKIKKDYLQKLKKVCDALDLSPIGFMVVSEAISNLIQSDEGAPVSAILIEHGRTILTLTLIRGGRNIQTIEGAIAGSEAVTADNLFKHFTLEVLPARIILYDDETSDELVQQFTSHSWSKSLPFLHMPQISVLPAGYEGQAVAYGAASQMGFEVLKDTEAEIKTFSKVKEPNEAAAEIAEEETEEDGGNTQEENFGFISGQDITEIEKGADEVSKPHHKSVKPVLLEEDGEIGSDEAEVDKSLAEVVVEESNFDDNRGVRRFFDKIKLPKLKIPRLPFSGLLVVAVVVILLIGAVAAGIYYFYTENVKAAVVVNLTPKNISENTEAVFDSASDNDFKNKILAAEEIKDKLDGEMTIGATGKKDVGEKATGSVTIYNNNTAADLVLSSGTVIKSENGLGFVTDKEIKVGSASGDIFSGTKPGTGTVSVTASEIGTNYNLPSDTKFSITGNSTAAGKNENAFSGGSKKTIKVVANDDLAELKKTLTKSLEEKAVDQLVKKTQTGSIVLPVILSTAVEQTKYDKKAGDEAKSVKLAAVISYTGLAYKNSDAVNFAKSIVQQKYGSEMTYNQDSINIAVKDAEKKSDSEISAALAMEASLLPKIDTNALSKQLSGKSKQSIDRLIAHLPQVEDTQVQYSPNLYILDKLFPNLPKHVTVTISSN